MHIYIYIYVCVYTYVVCACANVYSMYMYVYMRVSMYPSPVDVVARGGAGVTPHTIIWGGGGGHIYTLYYILYIII